MISELFGLREKLQQLDLTYNYQVHQLGLSAPSASAVRRWASLAKRFDEMCVLHSSAIPKPVHVLLAAINEETAEHMWPYLLEAPSV